MSFLVRPDRRFPVPCSDAGPFLPLPLAYFSGFGSQKEGHMPHRSALDLHEMYARLGGRCPL